jgi:hypothetical protein
LGLVRSPGDLVPLLLHISRLFTVYGRWLILYYNNCSNLGMRGNFSIELYPSSRSYADLLVNELGRHHDSYTWEYTQRTYYIRVDSLCNWTVSVLATAVPTEGPEKIRPLTVHGL